MAQSNIFGAAHSAHNMHLPDSGPAVSWGATNTSSVDNFAYQTRGKFEGQSITSQSLAETTSLQLKTGPQPELERFIVQVTENVKTWELVFAPLQVTPLEKIYQTITAHEYIMEPTAEGVPPRFVSYSIENKGFNMGEYNLGAEFRKEFQLESKNAPNEYSLAQGIIVNSAVKRAKVTALAGVNNSKMYLYEYYTKYSLELTDIREAWADETYWTFRLHKDPQAIYKIVDNAKEIFNRGPTPDLKPNMMVVGQGASSYIAFNEYEVDSSKRGSDIVQRNLTKGGRSVIANINDLDVYEHIPVRGKNVTQEETEMFGNNLTIADLHILDRSDIRLDYTEYEGRKLLAFQFINGDIDYYDEMDPGMAIRLCGKFDRNTGGMTDKLDSMLQNLDKLMHQTGFTMNDVLAENIDPHVFKVHQSFSNRQGILQNARGYAKVSVWGDQSETYFTNDQLHAHAYYAAKMIMKRIVDSTEALLLTMKNVLDGLFNYVDTDFQYIGAWAAAIALNPENDPGATGAYLKGNACGFVQPPYIEPIKQGEDNVGSSYHLYVNDNGKKYFAYVGETYSYKAGKEGAFEWPSNTVMPGFGHGNGGMTLAMMFDSGDYRGWDRELLRTCSDGFRALRNLSVPLFDYYCKGEVVNALLHETMLPAHQESPTMDVTSRKLIVLWNIFVNRIHQPCFVRRPFKKLISIRDDAAEGEVPNARYLDILASMGDNAIAKAAEKPNSNLLRLLFAHPFANSNGLQIVSNVTEAKKLFVHYKTVGLGRLMSQSPDFSNVVGADEFAYVWKQLMNEFSINGQVLTNEMASLFWTQIQVSVQWWRTNKKNVNVNEFSKLNLQQARIALSPAAYPQIEKLQKAVKGDEVQNNWVISRLEFHPEHWRLMYDNFKSEPAVRIYGQPIRPYNPVSLTTPLFAKVLARGVAPNLADKSSQDALDMLKISKTRFGEPATAGYHGYHMSLRDFLSSNGAIPPDYKGPRKDYYDREEQSYISPSAGMTNTNYENRIFNILPDLKNVVIHASNGETRNILIDRSPPLVRRLEYIDDHEKDPFMRLCATLYCFTRANRQSLENWLNRKVPFPFLSYMFVRPFIRFRTTPAFFARGGPETAITGHNYEDSNFELDINTKKYNLNVSCWMGYCVIREQNFFSRPHFKCERYEGGMGGTVFDDPVQFKSSSISKSLRSGFIFDCGSNFGLKHVLKTNYPFRLYGKVTASNIPYKLGDVANLYQCIEPPFPSYFFACHVWNWHKIREDNVINYSKLSTWKASKRLPEFAGLAKMLLYDPQTQKFSDCVMGRGHLENFDPPFKPVWASKELMKERYLPTVM